jgi:hypothetical protein
VSVICILLLEELFFYVVLAVNVYLLLHFVMFHDYIITGNFITNVFFPVESLYDPVDMVSHLGGSLS